MDKIIKIKFKKFDTKENSIYQIYDFNNYKIKNNSDLAKLCNVFINTKYEVFRILYMKDNQIIAQESMTNKVPNFVKLYNKKGDEIKFYEKMKSKLKRLNADGYYLTHNHTTDSSRPSTEDIQLTMELAKNVEGFIGHIVLNNSNKYSYISKDGYGDIHVENDMIINENLLENAKKSISNKTIYDVKITNRDELVALLKQINLEKDYSVAVLTDCKCNVRMVLEVPNRIFNDKLEAVNGLFKNLARDCGSTRVFIGTSESNVYSKLFEHQDFGTLKDIICLSENNNEITYTARNIVQKYDLFDARHEFKINTNNFIKDINKEYDSQNKLTILYKKVGQDPVKMEIEDTLEAKQKLVDGLIEVVPYEDALLVCNEEGKLMNLKPNLRLDYDYIAGNCFVIGDDYENAGFKSLSDEEISKYSKLLKQQAFKYLEFDEHKQVNNNKKFELESR